MQGRLTSDDLEAVSICSLGTFDGEVLVEEEDVVKVGLDGGQLGHRNCFSQLTSSGPLVATK